MNALKTRCTGKVNVFLILLLATLVLVVSVITGFALFTKSVTGNVLNYNLTEPLGLATTAKIEINPGDGNLMVDRVTSGEQVLASGTMQYFERQGLPSQSLNTSNGLATLTLKASSAEQSWSKLPWEACNGATEWQIHLNSTVQSELTTHSDGGNVNLNLAQECLSRVSQLKQVAVISMSFYLTMLLTFT